MKKIFAAIALITIMMLPARSASAEGAASMSVLPVYEGNSLAVTIRVEAGASKITAAQACVAFDRSKVEILDVSYKSTPLSSTTPSDPGAKCAESDVQISRYDLTEHPSGMFTLARINLRPLASSGQTEVTIDKAKSYLYDDSSSAANLLGSVNNYQKLMLRGAATTKPKPSKTAQRIMLGGLLALLLACFATLFKRRRKHPAATGSHEEI